MMKSWQEYLEEMMAGEMRNSEEGRLCAIMTSELAKKMVGDEGLKQSLEEEFKRVLRTQERMSGVHNNVEKEGSL